MNVPIMRLYALILVLFATLVGFTTWWTVFRAEELREEPENRRSLIEAQRIKRGTITSADGTVVAESVARGRGQQRIYTRRYPTGELFGHPVGYSFIELGQTEIELSQNDVLTGEENEFATLLDELQGEIEEGSNVTLTIDSDAQRVAMDSLRSMISSGAAQVGGSVVAIEPDTGAVRVMASVPSYDPNTVPQNLDELSGQEGSPMANRPTQFIDAPGSTMKVVTATAALDSGEFEPSSTLNADSPVAISGEPLANSGGQDFGTIDMTTALTNSVNTYWAQVGVELGPETMVEYMERYGFFEDPPLDFPPRQMAPSGIYRDDRLVTDGFDVGRVAIGNSGQEGEIRASTTQMAMVAAAVANQGTLMEPTLVQEVTDPDGRTTSELDPEQYREVMSEQTAATLTEMMTNVAETGTASGLSVSGATLAGKTGTAEINPATGLNRPWFIGFSPAEDPQIAVAATFDRCEGCFGGEVAGPVVTDVMGALVD